MKTPTLQEAYTYKMIEEWTKQNFPPEQYPEYEYLSNHWSMNRQGDYILKGFYDDRDNIYNNFKESSNPLIQIFLLNCMQNPDIDLKIKYYIEYFDYICTLDQLDNEYGYNNHLEVLIQLYMEKNDQKGIDKCLDYGLILFRRINFHVQEYINIGMIKIVIKYNKNKNTRYKSVYQSCIELLIDCITKKFIQNKDHNVFLYETLIECTKAIKDQDSCQKWRQELYNYYNTILDTMPNGMNSNYINNLLFLAEKLKVSADERFRLQEQQRKQGLELQKSFKYYELLTPEIKEFLNPVIDVYQNIVDISADFNLCLFRIMHHGDMDIFLCHSTDVTENKIPTDPNSLMSILGVKTQTLDAEGFTTNDILESYKDFNFPCSTYILYNVLIYMINKFNPTIEEFEFLIKDNPYIPEGLEKSTLKGLFAFVEKDTLLLYRLLVMNVEPIIRQIAHLCELPTKNKKKDYWEEDIAMSKFLENKKVMLEIGENNARELNIILFSRNGYQLRGQIAHGKAKDDTYSPIIFTLWFVMIRVLYHGTYSKYK